MSKTGSSAGFNDVVVTAEGVSVTVRGMLKERGFDLETKPPPPADLMFQVAILARAVAEMAGHAEAIAQRLEVSER